MRSSEARLASAAAVVAGVAVLMVAVAILGARGGWWSADFGRGFALVGVIGGAVAAVLGVVALAWGIRTRAGRPLVAALGLVLGLGLVIAALAERSRAAKWPPIHDVSTDLTNPPRFTALPVVANNLQHVPEQGRTDLAGLTDDLKWRMWHVERYGGLRSLYLPTAVVPTMRAVRALVARRGWTVAAFDPNGHLEATDTAGLFADRDDVAIDARVAVGRAGTVVSMRSVSRAEGGDAGRNAARIEALLADLRAGG